MLNSLSRYRLGQTSESTRVNKAQAVATVRERLEQDLQRTLAAARATEAAATDPESRSEGKYDTRALETSYLAAGQSEQVDVLAEAVRLVQMPASFPDYDPDAEIQAGALVEVEIAGEPDFFLLAPAAGGLMLPVDGQELTLLAPGAPLRAKLEGKQRGASLESPNMKVVSVS